jgi:kumamolisin
MHKFASSLRDEPDAKRVGDVDDNGHVRLTVVLRPGQAVVPEHHFHGEALSHTEYKARHSTDAATIAQLRRFAEAHGLQVEAAAADTNQMVLTGTYKQARAAFLPEQIGVYEAGGQRFVARSGHISVPEAIAGQIVAVMGFDQRPVARPHFRKRPAGSAHAAARTDYTPVELARRYQFPGGLDGSGQTIALIELGGGYRDAQVASYFTSIGVKRSGTLTAVPVDGASNAPGDPNGPDGEVQLDIEVAGAVAPAANIAVYFAPNQGSGFQDAIAAAIADQTNMPSIISISWGGPENGYATQDLDAMNQTLAKAMALGITVCVASGDSGAGDGERGKHVDFPSSSPYVLGCGGTSLPLDGPETVWNNGPGNGAGGGGYSAAFAKPAWQAGNTRAKRGVPDVAGDADPETGYRVSVDGKPTVIGGTSAVAPLWAGLIALINESIRGRAGFINATLYENPGALNDITSGNNSGYAAGRGWDPAAGLGSPIGVSVLAALKPDAAKKQAAE